MVVCGALNAPAVMAADEGADEVVSNGRMSRIAMLIALAPVLCGVVQVAYAADEPRVTASAHPASTAPVMAVSASLKRVGAVTQLSFDVSRGLAAKISVLESPDRVVLDLPQVNFQLDPAVGHRGVEPGALVRSFRFGMFAPGQSRIIIDLSGPAVVTHVRSESIDGGDPSRLTIELARTDRVAFHAAATASVADAPSGSAPTASVEPGAADARRVVVIDPGHGGIDPGASGLGGVSEKTITFDFASLLADKLNATGRYRAVLTRNGDSFVSLGDRVKIARDSEAALFISVHADTLAVNGAVTGATVYTCSDKASDAEAARVAATENDADTVAGVSATPDATGVNDILFDLTRRETRTYAHLFQRTLVGYWQKIARLNKNPERAAGFKVLQAPDVPSVLLELGYLSSEKDVKALTSPEWRLQATGSVVASIDAFFAPRSGASPSADNATLASAPSPMAATHAN